MTDNDIIEMSERCIRGNECDKCLYYELGRPDCMSAIISCQKEEIERLEKLVYVLVAESASPRYRTAYFEEDFEEMVGVDNVE